MSWDVFPLYIFPEGSLDSSVITTVWVGVAIVCFFNLRFGWSLAGLVVPGYLVPLLLINPWSVAVIIIEGMATYLIVWGISEIGGRYFGLANFFGRDRFFALVLASVAIRLLFDGLWLPMLAEWLNASYGLHFDYANHLHSFGLIIIALVANNFWKPGLFRGTAWLLVLLVITFLLVRYGLMEFTNFSASNLNYLYERVATSLLASPKAYIILLVTAYIASRMNLQYAWEYNGILIPSLLALQWYQPIKILATLAEVGVILCATQLLLKLPAFANVNLAGARKLFLFFTVGFIYKLGLGYALIYFAPQVQVTDYFAFGYLIATLLAVKIHDKSIGIRVTRATLQTSLTGVLLASIVGFSLSLLPRLHEANTSSQRSSATDANVNWAIAQPTSQKSLDEQLLPQRTTAYEVIAHQQVRRPNAAELSYFQDALQSLLRYRIDPKRQSLTRARRSLYQLGYGLVMIKDRYLVLQEHGNVHGWGTYVIDARAQHNLIVEVPAAEDEPGAIEAGLALFRNQDALGLALSGAWARSHFDDGADTTQTTGTLFHKFHLVMGRRNVLQVRRFTARTARQLQGFRQTPVDLSRSVELASQLWVDHRLPKDLKLRRLATAVGKLELHWGAPPLINLQRAHSSSGFAELYLQPSAVRPLMADSYASDFRQGESILRRRHGFLSQYIFNKAEATLRGGHISYRPPTISQLLFLDAEILMPLLRLVVQNSSHHQLSAATLRQLQQINRLAQYVGYRLLVYRDKSKGDLFIILENQPQAKAYRGWGVYVFRLNPSAPHLVEVPRPGYEQDTLEVGVALFRELQARALLVAGSHPAAEPRGRADVLDPQHKWSLFNLVHQVMLRQAGNTPYLATQVRGLSADATTKMKSLVAFQDIYTVPQERPDFAQELLRALQAVSLSPKHMIGSARTAGYEVGANPQAAYLAATENKDFAVVWVSSQAREAFAQYRDDRQRLLQFRALKINTLTHPLISYCMTEGVLSRLLPHAVVKLLIYYVQTGNIVALRALQRHLPSHDLVRLVDSATGQDFLLIKAPKGVVALVNLDPLSQHIMRASAYTSMRVALQRFVKQHAFLLTFEEQGA